MTQLTAEEKNTIGDLASRINNPPPPPADGIEAEPLTPVKDDAGSCLGCGSEGCEQCNGRPNPLHYDTREYRKALQMWSDKRKTKAKEKKD